MKRNKINISEIMFTSSHTYPQLYKKAKLTFLKTRAKFPIGDSFPSTTTVPDVVRSLPELRNTIKT